MKKVLFLFVSVLALGLTSCNKDDDSGSSNIEGKWAYSQEGTEVSGQEVLYAYENDCTSQKDYVEIASGGTFSDHLFWDDCEEDVTTGAWSREGNSLTVTMGGETVTAEILTLDSSTLKLKATVEGYILIQVFTRM